MVARPDGLNLRKVVVLGLVSLLAMLALTACDEGPRPPLLSVDEIAGFEASVQPIGSLDALVAAYNQASSTSFSTETTPDPLATLHLKDGSRIQLQFSDLFPRDCVLVYVDSERQQEAGTFYEVKAPGLLGAVCGLFGIDPTKYEPPH